MNDLDRFQALQRLLVTAGFSSTLDVRRESDHAVITLSVELGKQDSEGMASLVELTRSNGFAFTVEGDRADVTLV
jgi:hypothetical protein